MATSYSIADTHDNEAGYVAFDPQPNCPDGIRYLYLKAASGKEYADGVGQVELLFEYLTPTQYAAVLAAAGLTSAVYNDVTIALPDVDRATFSDYNATVYHQQTREYRTYFNGRYTYAKLRVEVTGTT